MSTQAIDQKCGGTPPFQTNDELRRTTVWKYIKTVDNPVDTEKIGRTYGWPIGKWDVSKLEDFSHVFYDRCSTFNEDISEWSTSRATTMYGMFWMASSFNQPVGDWNTSNVRYMASMFCGATCFNQPLTDWDIISRVHIIRLACFGMPPASTSR